MKLSTAVSTPDAVFSALALKGEFKDTFAFAAKHGLDGVEISVRDPKTVDFNTLAGLQRKYSLVVPAIGTGRAFGEDGLCFSDPDVAVRDAAVERVLSHVSLAERLNSNVIIGLILGKNPRTPQTEELAADCMRRVAGPAADRGVSLFIEPINRYETGFIITADDCLSFLDIVGLPNCKVLLDTFHMNIEEADMCATVRKVGGRIGHVHIADSNRRYPGAGHIDFPAIVAALRDAGYDGFLSAEMFPHPDPDTSVAAMAKYMRALIQ